MESALDKHARREHSSSRQARTEGGGAGHAGRFPSRRRRRRPRDVRRQDRSRRGTSPTRASPQLPTRMTRRATVGPRQTRGRRAAPASRRLYTRSGGTRAAGRCSSTRMFSAFNAWVCEMRSTAFAWCANHSRQSPSAERRPRLGRGAWPLGQGPRPLSLTRSASAAYHAGSTTAPSACGEAGQFQVRGFLSAGSSAMQAAARARVLVAGDVEGRFDAVFKRVAALNASNGPFDMVLCVGRFFAPDGAAAAWCPRRPSRRMSLRTPVPVDRSLSTRSSRSRCTFSGAREFAPFAVESPRCPHSRGPRRSPRAG